MISSLLPDGAFDWNRVVPFLLLSMVWLYVLQTLIYGLRTGRLRAFRRNQGSDTFDDRPPMNYERKGSPISFWALFGFYVLVLVVIPLMFMAVFLNPPKEPTINPGRGVESKTKA